MKQKPMMQFSNDQKESSDCKLITYYSSWEETHGIIAQENEPLDTLAASPYFSANKQSEPILQKESIGNTQLTLMTMNSLDDINDTTECSTPLYSTIQNMSQSCPDKQQYCRKLSIDTKVGEISISRHQLEQAFDAACHSPHNFSYFGGEGHSSPISTIEGTEAAALPDFSQISQFPEMVRSRSRNKNIPDMKRRSHSLINLQAGGTQDNLCQDDADGQKAHSRGKSDELLYM